MARLTRTGNATRDMSALDAAMESVADAWDRESPDRYATDNEHLAAIFRLQAATRRSWNRRRDCVFPGCRGRVVGRSHTLPLSGALNSVAEGGHLVCPVAEVEPLRIEVQRVGVREASTFPGFCEDHERIFSRFEVRGFPDGFEDLYLQFFRVACRELRVIESNLAQTQNQLRELQRRQDEFGKRHLERAMGLDIASAGIQAVTFNFETAERRILTRSLQTNQRRAAALRDGLVAALADTATDLSDEFFVIHADLSIVIPVCLTAHIGLKCNGPSGIEPFDAMFLAWPHRNGTVLAAMCRREFWTALDGYFRGQIARPVGALAMVEDWMVHGSDHWFLRPSVWNALDTSKQDAIIGAFSDFRRGIGADYERSIFDATRREWIRDTDTEALDEEGRAVLIREQEKLGPAGATIHAAHEPFVAGPPHLVRDWLTRELESHTAARPEGE